MYNETLPLPSFNIFCSELATENISETLSGLTLNFLTISSLISKSLLPSAHISETNLAGLTPVRIPQGISIFLTAFKARNIATFKTLLCSFISSNWPIQAPDVISLPFLKTWADAVFLDNTETTVKLSPTSSTCVYFSFG